MSAGHTLILGTERAAKEAFRVILAAPPGSVMSVKPPTRTIPQNRKMQAMLSDVARAKPGGRLLRPDQWKCLVMDAVAEETGNDAFRARWEPGLIPGTVVNLGHRSSRLTRSEMGELIDWLEAWGAEQGVEFTHPEDQREDAA